jgi:hypothetical protein
MELICDIISISSAVLHCIIHSRLEEYMTTHRKYQCQISKRLDEIRMTAAERQAARAYLEQGMCLVDGAFQFAARMRLIASQLGRGLRGRRERLTH